MKGTVRQLVLAIATLCVISMTANAQIVYSAASSQYVTGYPASDCSLSGSTESCPDAGIGSDGILTCDANSTTTAIQYHTNGQIECWFYTGYITSTSGYFQIPNNQAMQPSPSTNQKHCIMFLTHAQTFSQYAAGYPAFSDAQLANIELWQDGEVASGSNQNAYEQIGWKTADGNAIPSYLTMAVHIFCPIQ